MKRRGGGGGGEGRRKRDNSTAHSLEEALGPGFTVRCAYEYISNHSSGPLVLGLLRRKRREKKNGAWEVLSCCWLAGWLVGLLGCINGTLNNGYSRVQKRDGPPPPPLRFATPRYDGYCWNRSR